MDDPAECPPPGPGTREEPLLDIEHLHDMTLGDVSLEREVLQLFDRQAALVLERLACAQASVVASCAHTVKGSARGIGAWRVARAAEQVEQVAVADGPDLPESVAQLAEAVQETRRAIARHLGVI
jgi:HPt (histidine-containing phosphotransfer) domain-containing protein